MKEILTLFHGSDHIIEKPLFNKGCKYKDYGHGFYCTEDENLAAEWAVSALRDGVVNRYTLDLEYLNILNLNTPNHTILNWIAILINNRIFTIKTPIVNKAKRYLLDNFYVNVNAYDLIVGYRADDSYFDFAEAFLNNSISINQLSKSMVLGNLGLQVVLKSEYAFSLLKFDEYKTANSDQFYASKKNRENEANKIYHEILEIDDDSLYIRDIIREGITNNDKRIPRNICT